MKRFILFSTILIIVVVLLAMLCSGPAKNGNSLKSKEDVELEMFAAYSAAESYVKQFLKSPSTTTFPNASKKIQHVTDLGGKKFRINSWVDSQNSFGAIIRTKFSITVTLLGDKAKCSDFVILK